MPTVPTPEDAFRASMAANPVATGTYLGQLAMATQARIDSTGEDFDEAIAMAAADVDPPLELDARAGLSSIERDAVAILLQHHNR